MVRPSPPSSSAVKTVSLFLRRALSSSVRLQDAPTLLPQTALKPRDVPLANNLGDIFIPGRSPRVETDSTLVLPDKDLTWAEWTQRQKSLPSTSKFTGHGVSMFQTQPVVERRPGAHRDTRAPADDEWHHRQDQAETPLASSPSTHGRLRYDTHIVKQHSQPGTPKQLGIARKVSDLRRRDEAQRFVNGHEPDYTTRGGRKETQTWAQAQTQTHVVYSTTAEPPSQRPTHREPQSQNHALPIQPYVVYPQPPPQLRIDQESQQFMPHADGAASGHVDAVHNDISYQTVPAPVELDQIGGDEDYIPESLSFNVPPHFSDLDALFNLKSVPVSPTPTNIQACVVSTNPTDPASFAENAQAVTMTRATPANTTELQPASSPTAEGTSTVLAESDEKESISRPSSASPTSAALRKFIITEYGGDYSNFLPKTVRASGHDATAASPLEYAAHILALRRDVTLRQRSVALDMIRKAMVVRPIIRKQ